MLRCAMPSHIWDGYVGGQAQNSILDVGLFFFLKSRCAIITPARSRAGSWVTKSQAKGFNSIRSESGQARSDIRRKTMTAIESTLDVSIDDMTPRAVPTPDSPAPLRQQPRRRSSLDFIKKAATSGKTRIRTISNTSIRSLFAQDDHDTTKDDDAQQCTSNNVPEEITIGGSDSTALAEPTANPTGSTGRPARRSRRRSSYINSSKTRDSFEIMVRNAGGSDDVRRGSMFRPRPNTLEELALMSAAADAVDAADDDDGNNNSDEAHIHRLVASLNMTSAHHRDDRATAVRTSSSDVRRLPTKSILRSSSQPNLNEPGVGETNFNSATPAVEKSRFLRRRSTSSVIASSTKRCKAVL